MVPNNVVKNKKSTRASRAFPKVAMLLICCFALIFGGGIISYSYVMNNHDKATQVKKIKINETTAVDFEIPRGANTAKIAALLEEKGIIRSSYFFKILSKVNGYDGMYQSGTHKVSKGLSYDDLMRILTGTPMSVSITFAEGLNNLQIQSLLLKKKLINVNQFNKIVDNEVFNYLFLKDLPLRENRLEGYLFPDTYKFDVAAGEKFIIETMLRNFDKKFKPEYYKRVQDMNTTIDKVVTLASMIEREAKVDAEREVIAGVFYNRLKAKQRLESCATIQYIFYKKEGIIKEKISDADTKVIDPYNTYQNKGLPPGPICNPGEKSIKAALYPDKHDYMYFVAKGDGTHIFSKTLKEHNAAKLKYELK